MKLRISFTPEDLSRVRVVDTWGPLGEALFSLTTLQERGASGLLGGWREKVHRGSAVSTHPALALFQSPSVDLLTVTGRTHDVGEALASLLAAHPDHLGDEIGSVARARALSATGAGRWLGTSWGDPAYNRNDRQELVTLLRDHHRVAIAPHWPHIRTWLQAEQARYARILAERGVEVMLASLPGFRWSPPVLETGLGAPTYEVELGGRGLLLVPSFFSQNTLNIYTHMTDEQAAPVVFVPAVHSVPDVARVLTAGENGTLKALEKLLGRTRAHALDAISQGPCSTGQLAQRLSLSLATASEHATVLRQAGLISTTRHGAAVHHALTALGAAVLNGHPHPEPRATGSRYRAGDVTRNAATPEQLPPGAPPPSPTR